MLNKIKDPAFLITFLSGLKLILIPLGIDVFSDAEIEAIANGVAAATAVGVVVYAKIQAYRAKKALEVAETALAQLKTELKAAQRSAALRG